MRLKQYIRIVLNTTPRANYSLESNRNDAWVMMIVVHEDKGSYAGAH